MTDRRNITKEDIYLKARLIAEGVRHRTGGPGKKRGTGGFILDGCELPIMAFPNRFSRLELIYEGDTVTITDMGKEIAAGRLGSSGIPFISIHLNYGCHNRTMGLACRYCNKNWGKPGLDLSGPEVRKETMRQVDRAASIIQHGWRGPVIFSQGVLPPDQRNEITGLMEDAMARFRESLDGDTFGELPFAPNVYPPDDFDEMFKWKQLGFNSVLFDLEVMDPAYWNAICPGKGTTYTHEYWMEAQVAAAEIFGRGRGSVSSTVIGIEPMAGLVEGVEERISKGVYTIGYMFYPAPNSGYEGFRPPTAPWFVEATENIVDAYVRHADTLEVNLLDDDRPGYTQRGRSLGNIIIEDEMTRRLQEMGKMPPGLPIMGEGTHQDGHISKINHQSGAETAARGRLRYPSHPGAHPSGAGKGKGS